jgi:hypothetical protein
MYPTTDVKLDPQLPSAAQFWTPSQSDLEEDEGFGFFREVWPIFDITETEAREITLRDRSLAVFVSNLAANNVEFDLIATAVETGSVEDIEGLTQEQYTALTPYMTDMTALENLEIGVAGLAYSLAAAGMYPAASCRGHPAGWSEVPVVFLAADREHAQLLQPLVREAGCGFDIDPDRPELLVILSRSIEETLGLADAILGHLFEFTINDRAAE